MDFEPCWHLESIVGFIMGGAILIAAIAFNFAKIHPKALLGDVIRLPSTRQIDRRLVLGGLFFGVGWGFAGYCPGPALVSLAYSGSNPLIFIVTMVVGMAILEIQDRRRARTNAKQSNKIYSEPRMQMATTTLIYDARFNKRQQ
ncbi:YeeE/YedE family protein [Candidatus Nitrotoga sp. M5]|uniref:YeeE/YedE family protein n=1 Tax=Candidatus Nitrotoga sp. M5 TaxID=2890409 RepID=UPI002A4E2513|nr:YeeE/YedE family protein [Candidatus Nitrotoga sp. M5]